MVLYKRVSERRRNSTLGGFPAKARYACDEAGECQAAEVSCEGRAGEMLYPERDRGGHGDYAGEGQADRGARAENIHPHEAMDMASKTADKGFMEYDGGDE